MTYKFFSGPQVIENSRQYLLVRTDILQKRVVGCSLGAPDISVGTVAISLSKANGCIKKVYYG